MMEEKKIKINRLKAATNIAAFMADYYKELDQASEKGGQKIAWCTSVGPAEILRAMGFLVFFPETHAAMIGATRMAADLIPEANAIGYSPEICSYLTADIGAYLKKITPLSRAYQGIHSVPKPDVLVFNTNQCRDVQDWFSWYGTEFNAPVIGVHTHRGVNNITAAHVASISGQMQSLVEPLENISGTRLDPEKLEVIEKLK
jgi:benzoyl-CoA reductase/2-hydroxyglutaryl-CoA dehydratase subunit BcrC/BadD/HgdB